MTGPLDPDSILDGFLAPEHDRLPDRVLEAVLSEIARTPQRRAPRVPWRFPMSRRLRLAGLALASAAAIIVASAVLLGGGSQQIASPSPSLPAPPGSPISPSPSSALRAPLGYTGGGTIEFTRHDASGADVLWTIDPSGANATLVLERACCGLFSPDGRQLAVAAPGVTLPSITRDPSLLGVEVLDAPGSRVAFVVPTGCAACAVFELNYEPDAWSPDGRYIALTMWSDSDPNQAGMAIADRDFSIPWDWADLRATGFHADIPLGFSPDSSQLLFMRTEQTVGPTSIGPLYVLAVGDGSVRQISPAGVTLSANGLTQGPASWSPDGQRIAFAGKDTSSGRTSIYVIGAEPGAEVETLVDSAPGATSARYSPDGSLIAFDSADAGFHDLFVVNPDGSGLLNLTGDFAPGVCCAQWSPDGKAMLVAGTTSDDLHNDLFIVVADGSGVWQVTTEPNAYTGFLWGAGFR
jgi:hypothetical protein